MKSKDNTIADKAEENCCGCGACEAICPVDAIKMILDEDGFYYPKMNDDTCVSCGLCRMVCVF